MSGSIHVWSTTPASNDAADAAINWAEFMAPDQVNDSARQMMGRIAEYIADTTPKRTSTGAANTYAVTISSTPAALTDGLPAVFVAHQSNTGASTLAVNSFGAVALRSISGSALRNGEIQYGQTVIAFYKSATNEFLIANGAPQLYALYSSILSANSFGLSVGDVKLSLASSPDAGFVRLTDSVQTLSKASYPDLNTWASGQSYPWGSASTTFNIPAAGGYFLRFGASGSSVDAGGPRTPGTSQEQSLKSHTHTATTGSDGAHTHTVGSSTGVSVSGGGTSLVAATGTSYSTGSSGSHTHAFTTDSTGDGTENRPINVTMYADMLATPALVASGLIGAVGFAYQFSTGTSGDPGTGYLGFDSATLASASTMRISETDYNGGSLDTLLTALPSGTRFLITAVGEPATFVFVEVSSVGSDSGTYKTFTLSLVSSGGSFANGDRVSVAVFGANGVNGTTVPDISGLTEDTANNDETDYLIEYDTSVSGHKKVKPKNIGFTQAGTGASLRSLQSKLREFVSVTDYGAIGDNSTDCTTAFSNAKTYAVANLLAIVVPAGSFRVDEAFDWGNAAARWWLLPGAIIRDLSGNPHQGYAASGYLGDFGVMGVPSDSGTRIISPYATYLEDTDATSPGGQGTHVWSSVRAYDGTDTAAYNNIGANIVGFAQYGARLSGSSRASGSTNSAQFGINVYRADNGSTGRTEICPLGVFAHNLSTTPVQVGLNYYNDFCISGPKSASSSDREGFLAGLQLSVHKYTSGNTLDSTHDGSYGLSIATLPGISPGFSPEDKSSHQTYGLRAGVSIVGWAGPSTATDGTHASATTGYDVGIMVGGLGGSVWNEVTNRSKIGVGIQVTDYTTSGIDIFTKHPSATAGTEPALRVYTDAGPTLLGLDSTADTNSILEVGSGATQFASGIKLRESTHASSRRAGIMLGDWIVGQDNAGSGTKDFFVYGGTSPAMQMTISTAGVVTFNSQRITSVADPSSAQDVATKNYVDTVAQGLDPKASVKCATTANITLSGEQTIDGVTTSASRVLVKNQSTASQNGIYVSASGSWTRATDMDVWTEVPGAFVFVEEGTTYADTGWVCTSNSGGTIGSTSMAWSQFSGAGTYSAGTGLSLSGTQFSIDSTVATLTGSQTLTNKTLTAPIISTISNTGTLTLPTSTDTLVGRATTDTLTNKTLTSPTINTATISGGTVNNAPIGGTTPAAGAFTTLSATGDLSLASASALGWNSGEITLTRSASNVLKLKAANSLTLGGDTAQFPQAFNILASSHASSRRAAFTFGDFQFLQDTAGTGTKDFGVWNGSNYSYQIDAAGGAHYWLVSGSTAMTLTTAQNVKIGGSASRGTTEGTNQLVIFNGTAPVGTLTNGASFYAASGEMRVMDSAGNSTLLSPHDHDTNEWIYHSVDTRTGSVLRIDMERMMRAINAKFGWDFVHEFTV